MDEFCENCIEIITNPVCPDCLTNQIKYWLIDIGMDKFPQEIIMEKIKKELSLETLNEEKCIICKNERISLCSYCIFLKVSRVLKEFNFDKQLTRDFQEIFNYSPDSEEDYTKNQN
jgi:hypothetical protein